MRLLLKTSFDKQPRKLMITKLNLTFENKDLINLKQHKHFADIENTGMLSIRIMPTATKAWLDSLPKEVKDENYILFFDNGWISIPGNTVTFMAIE